MPYYVYVLTNYKNTTLYVGITNDIHRRIQEHRNEKFKNSFSKRYRLKKLIYTEEYEFVYDALEREKQLKRWHKEWKWNLIKEHNPKLENLL